MRNKIIAAVLTAALAVSPVFVTPISASDGQEVESEASSWRYQDGDIIAEDSVSALDADMELLEDYNAQMGSSMEEAAEEPTAPEVLPAEDQVTEPAAEPVADQAAEQVTDPAAVPADETAAPEEQPAEKPAEDSAAKPEAEPAADQEGLLSAQQTEEVPAAEAPAAEPEVTALSATVKDKYWTWSSGSVKRGPGYLKGIDVSYWQGTINWKKVKAAGVDFAIIRCGYGANTSSKDDSKFAANVAGCKANGIPYGVYLYSYANTVSEAKDEADHAIRLLKKNNCSLGYPVYYDLEDEQVDKASNATIRNMANAFCSRLQSNGYPAGVYANLNWWNNKLTGIGGYDKWVAQWASSCSYKSAYSVWQCTSEAKVSGISGKVDANLLMCPKSAMDSYMKTGWKPVTYSIRTIDGRKYAVSSKGDIVKNAFLKIGGYYYGFDTEGVMQTGRTFWIGCKAYILDSQGRAYINKSKTKKKAPYYAKAGSGKKGTLKKGKKFYVLRTSGKWSQMANGYWIRTKYLKKTAVYPKVKPSVNVEYKAKLKKKTTSRSGPSSSYIAKKKFKKNKTVTVIGTYGSWSKVSTGQWLPSGKLKKK